MLSDREENTLREVQRRLASEDPTFVRSFDDAGQQYSTWSLQWPAALPRAAHTAAIVVALAFCVLMLVARAPGTALLFAAVAATIAVAGRRRDDPPSTQRRRDRP